MWSGSTYCSRVRRAGGGARRGSGDARFGVAALTTGIHFVE